MDVQECCLMAYEETHGVHSFAGILALKGGGQKHGLDMENVEMVGSWKP